MLAGSRVGDQSSARREVRNAQGVKDERIEGIAGTPENGNGGRCCIWISNDRAGDDIGQLAPSKRIKVGAIEVGRISRVHDMPGILQFDRARIVGVCDLDAHRIEDGKSFVRDFYPAKTGKSDDGVTGYGNYHDLLAGKDIDAVLASTPDLWHALIGIDEVRPGKGVCLQKPAPLMIAEGRALGKAVQTSGQILQIGGPQSSTAQFRYPVELVRNERIGDVQRAEVGLPGDPPGGEKTPMPAPDGSN